MFVAMYHPDIPSTITKPVEVALQSVDDHAARGWLLVTPGAELPTPATPYYTTAAADSRFVRGTQLATKMAEHVGDGSTFDLAQRAASGSVAAVVTAAGALVVQKHNPVDATAGPLTMTLPTGQLQGTQLSVEKTDSSSNTVTISGSVRGVGSSTVSLPWKNEALLLRADASGSWWPVAGHKTKTALDATYDVRATPAHAGVRLGRFDPMRSIYNLKASNTRRMRAAVGAARAGSGTCRVFTAGDSLTAGYLSTKGTDDPISLLRGLLANAGQKAAEVVHTYSNITDARWTTTGTWNPGTLDFPWPRTSGTATRTISGTGTVMEILATNATTNPWTYSIDGAAAVTVAAPGTPVNSVRQVLVTGLAPGAHTVTISSSAANYFYAAGFHEATGFILENGGLSGSTTADWLARSVDPLIFGPIWSAILGRAAALVPDVVFLELGVNDSSGTVPLATFKTNLTTLIGHIETAGSTAVLVTSNRPAIASRTDAVFNSFLSAIYDVADSADVPLLDLADRFGPYTEYNADGLGYDQASDALHLTPAGNAHKAAAWAAVLTA